MMVEPYVEPVMHSMPFNLSEFAARYNLSMPDVFQSEESPRPGIELAKQVASTSTIGPSQHVSVPSLWWCHGSQGLTRFIGR